MKKEREPKYIPSPLNNNMINYKEYYMGANEKIGYSLLIFVIGGLVGLVFYGGLFKSDGDATLATHISNAIFFCIVGIVALKFFMKTFVLHVFCAAIVRRFETICVNLQLQNRIGSVA